MNQRQSLVISQSEHVPRHDSICIHHRAIGTMSSPRVLQVVRVVVVYGDQTCECFYAIHQETVKGPLGVTVTRVMVATHCRVGQVATGIVFFVAGSVFSVHF